MNKQKISIYKTEEFYTKEGFPLICGVDEAGRGPLAGPVSAAAVILDPSQKIDGLNDSKKLSEKKREALFPEIIEKSLCYSVVFCDHLSIDRQNILSATMQAMQEAILSLKIKPDICLIDGNKSPKLPSEYNVKNIIGGDAVSANIAAASILAKVSRDRHMVLMDDLFPEYHFAKHKGYGTKLHYEALLAYGPSSIHRRSFIRNLGRGKFSAGFLGHWGEDIAAKYLENAGFTILERNFYSRYGEIDIIAKNESSLIFIEVKTQLNSAYYLPRDRVSKAKQAKIIKTAESYLLDKKIEQNLRFDVIEIIAKDVSGTLEEETLEHIENAFITG